jgi:peptidoglycan hydrolase-like protein with peptidoglycan-binding domain
MRELSSVPMRARLHGGRAVERRFAALGGARRYGQRRLGARPFSLGVLLVLAVAATGVAGAMVASHKGGIGSLLSSKPTGSAPAAPERPVGRTRIVRLPGRRVGNATERLTVTLSGRPAPGSPKPRLRPAVAGSWSVSGDSEVFRSAATLQPCASYRLTVPAGTRVLDRSSLGSPRTVSLQVACPSTRALQEALARLAYLPDSLHSAPGVRVPRGAVGRRLAAHLLYEPPHGRLRPDLAFAPPLSQGSLDNTTKGALMIFQEDHKLQPDGTPGPLTWQRLLSAVANNYRDPQRYTFVTVSESLPETLVVRRGDRVLLSSPTNTGVPGAETEKGAFPIFERFTSTTMTGTNPDGTKYSDPGVPWVNYFNGGDAVHGFIRPGYGYPQSNGCVELPIETAQRVYGMLRLGDIVVVS